MTQQANVSTAINYKVESAFGQAATNTGGQALRRISSSLNLNKDSFASNEVRADMQVSDLRHGMRSVRGSIEGELSTQSYDDFIEAALRGTWAAGATASPTEFATGVTTAASGGTGTFTFAGASSLITRGFKVGDIVRATGLSQAANNNRNFRIVALTATVMTVFPAPTAATQQASGWAFAVAGRKVMNGLVERSFTIEQSYPDVDVSELFIGNRIGGMSINAQPNGMVTTSFEVMGLNGSVLTAANAPYFAAPNAQQNTGILSAVNGALRLNGAEQAVVTGLSINMTNSLNMQPVIGSVVAPNIFYGRQIVTGQVSAFLDDELMLNAFYNETEMDIVAVMNAAGAPPEDFIAFNMQRVKFSVGNKTIGAEGGVIVQFNYQALLRSGGSGTAFDQATMAVQRSNS
jgi:hypothetical protein